MSIFLGLIMLLAGSLIVIKSEWLLQNFGRIGWFEEKLGAEGGSRLGYKLIGIIIIFLGIIVLTGGWTAFLTWLLSPLLKYNL